MSTKLEHFLPFTIKTLTTATVSLPLFSFAFCIFWSFIFDLEVSSTEISPNSVKHESQSEKKYF